DRRLALGAVVQLAAERLERLREVREDHVLLGGEVAEERARRDVGPLGDVRDRGLVVPALVEQAQGGRDDRLARALLLAFTETGFGHAEESSCIMQQAQLCSGCNFALSVPSCSHGSSTRESR